MDEGKEGDQGKLSKKEEDENSSAVQEDADEEVDDQADRHQFELFVKSGMPPMDVISMVFPLDLQRANAHWITVREVKERLVALQHAVRPQQLNLYYNTRKLEEERTLADYGIEHGCLLWFYLSHLPQPHFPLASLPHPSTDDVADQILPCPAYPPGKVRRVGRELHQLLGMENVHLWRVDKDSAWLELIIEGSPDSFYAGGEFLMHVAFPKDYPFEPLALRMLTPIYHPYVGPDGEVAILKICPAENWSPSYTCPMIVRHLLNQLNWYKFPPSEWKLDMAILRCALEEWYTKGEEWVKEEARRWTYHYANEVGRTLMRNGDRCMNLRELAMLARCHPQVRAEIRATLLCANRGARAWHGEFECSSSWADDGGLMGRLPRELIYHILLYLGHDRWQTRSIREWRVKEDDGLPVDWRPRLRYMLPPTPAPEIIEPHC